MVKRHYNTAEIINEVHRKLERDETGMMVAQCPSIPGCVSRGAGETEALANIREAIEACLEARAANGFPMTVATREVEVTV